MVFSGTGEYVDEPGKNVPVLSEVDVAVAGGGMAGIMAALAAARQGAKTLLVDRFGQLGGWKTDCARADPT